MKIFQITQKTSIILLMMILSITAVFAQKPIDKMTKEDILVMSYDQLADLPLDELMRLADIVGVSIDDLFNMVLNKDVSIASKSSESFFDTPLSTSVLSSDDIARAGVLSIPEALRLIPGIIVREKTNGNYDVHIRGNDNIPYGQHTYISENTLTLVMIDGRPVYNYSTGGTFWESLPIGLGDVDRIEVVRGPASALYGANAVTGVINIITKKVSSKKPSVEAGLQSGNRFGNMPSSMAVSGAQNLALSFGVNDKLKFRVSGNYNYRDRPQEDIWMWSVGTQTPGLDQKGYYPPEEVTRVRMNADEMYDDPYISLDAYGANAYVFYNPNENAQIDFAIGTQRSTAISSNTDNGYIPHTTRKLETQYADLRAAIHGFNFQASYMWGYEDISMGSPGYQLDLYNLYVNADYNFQLLDKKLSIRPGFSYARSMLNDTPYLIAGEDVLLNGKKYLGSYAPSVRLDYSPFEKLRLVGAFRYEQNEIPAKAYPTWQFVANYKLYETSSIRATYSRANRSPFMLDMRADATIRVDLPVPNMHSDNITSDPKNKFTVFLDGNPNLKLATMDMFELGYRRKLGKHVLMNFEAFYNKLRNISFLDIDEVKLTLAQDLTQYPYPPQITQVSGLPYPYERHQTYNNIKETSQQYGVTAEFGVVVNQKVNFRLFATYQHTNLKNHDSIKVDQKVELISESVANPATWSDEMTVTEIPTSFIDTDSKATPSLYGGFEINWLPTDKWTFTSTGYGYTKQTFIHQYGTFHIKAKMLVNLRVAYRFAKSCSVFMNVNNIFDSKSQEFGFMDKTGVQWYWGAQIKF
jgi:iron complex outermembrane receptor protein